MVVHQNLRRLEVHHPVLRDHLVRRLGHPDHHARHDHQIHLGRPVLLGRQRRPDRLDRAGHFVAPSILMTS